MLGECKALKLINHGSFSLHVKENNNSWSQAYEEAKMLVKTSDCFWLRRCSVSVDVKGGQKENCSLENCSLVEQTPTQHLLLAHR